MAAKKATIKHTKKSKTVLFTLFLLFIAVGTHIFLSSQFFICRDVTITGFVNLEKDQLLEIAEIPEEQNIFTIDGHKISQNLMQLSMIKSVQVEKELPRTLIIHVEERKPTALLIGSNKFILIDEEGVYLEDIESLREYGTLPLITGIQVDEDRIPGTTITSEILNEALLLVAEVWPGYQKYFNEVNVAGGKSAMLLYTHDGVAVRVGNVDDINDKLLVFEQLYSSHLKDTAEERLDYIDVSYEGFPVVKYK